jgi:hypothetical protein
MPIERTNSFHLLLSDDELKLLKLLAENEGLNASDYLRMLIRTMPNSSSNLVRGMRLGAVLSGKLDVAQVFEATAAALRSAKTGTEGTTKPKKTK